MKFLLRKAVLDDRARLAALIRESVRGLAPGFYDAEQIERSIETVFGVDTELIDDGTYFIVEAEDRRLAGCGGWSKRKTLFGASDYEASRDPGFLDPSTDAAKIRAFFIHPDFARRGVGTLILDECEREARAAGFKTAEMMATLPGVPLYRARGYRGDEEFEVAVGGGVSIRCVKMRKDLNTEKINQPMKYAAFLRGINVGGKTIIRMEALRATFAALGVSGVRTYIQSGNVVFEADETDESAITERIAAAVERDFFKTPVMVRSIDEIAAIIDENPFKDEHFEEKLFHVVFLDAPLSEEQTALLLAKNGPTEDYAVRGREIYCFLRRNVSDSALGKDFLGKKLKVAATGRNLRTLGKILELAGEK